MIRPPPSSPLFPYTTLFRSAGVYDPRGMCKIFFAMLAGFAEMEREMMIERTNDGLAQATAAVPRSEEHTSELQSRENLVCRLLLEKKKKKKDVEHTQIKTSK